MLRSSFVARALPPLLGAAVLIAAAGGLPAEQAAAVAEGGEAAVLFRCGFESADWWQRWGLEKPPRRTGRVLRDPERRFEPVDGHALRVRVAEGDHYGLSLAYRFREQLGREPEQVFFRYRLRLADDWNPVSSGKLPGIAGTYGRAGWGGRRVDGTDGWSARGLFDRPQAGRTPIGFYCYHADMRGRYGAHWGWQDDGFSGLANNRWYRIEQQVRLNTPGRADGVLRGWVDGRLVFEKTDVRFRDVPALKIEMVWVNVYHGGRQPAASEDHLYLDDLVISERRLGQ
jgi:hypothetical protein